MEMEIDIEEIWKDAMSITNSQENEVILNQKEKESRCNYCDSDNIIYDCSIICGDCGTVINYFVEYSSYSFEEPIQVPYRAQQFNSSSSRLKKMQEWMAYTNTEKNEYKLKEYIRDLCVKLQIQENIIESVCLLVNKVMNSIKDKNDGPKRSRVKDGIIISCIYYISKEHNLQLKYAELAKKINLDTKYISKADKILMELNFLNEDIVNKMVEPIDYIKSVVKKYTLHTKISNLNDFIDTTQVLINICEDNDILVDHTPLSIGCCCFYYILKHNNVEVDTSIFADMFGISNVTLIKTYNKLKILQNKINKLL